MAAADPEKLRDRVIEGAERYINSREAETDGTLEDDFESERNFSRIVEQVHSAHFAGTKSWDLLYQDRPCMCRLYLSVLEFLDAMTSENIPLTRLGIMALVPNMTLSIAHTISNQESLYTVKTTRLVIERLFANLASLHSEVNAPGVSRTSPTKSPKRLSLKPQSLLLQKPSPRNVLDPRSPRLGILKEDDPVTGWYARLVDTVYDAIPNWVFMYRVSITMIALAICSGLYYWLIGNSLFSLSSRKHESVSNIPVVFPNGTGVGFDMADQLEAYSLHMQNTVKVYESAEDNVQHVVAGIIALTDEFARSLGTLGHPPWYVRSPILRPLAKALGVEMPKNGDPHTLAFKFGSEISQTLYRLSLEEKEKLRNSLDQLDVHLYSIQKSILGHDFKLQLSKFFHDISHLQFSPMFEGIDKRDLPKSLATLKMFNEKYRHLREGFVFMLHEKIEQFEKGWNDMIKESEKVPEWIKTLRKLSWDLERGLKEAIELKFSLDGENQTFKHDEEL